MIHLCVIVYKSRELAFNMAGFAAMPRQCLDRELNALNGAMPVIHEVGTHSVLFCEVEAVRIADRVEGLIYFNRAYHPIGERIAG
jgi:hypothetical protein